MRVVLTKKEKKKKEDNVNVLIGNDLLFPFLRAFWGKLNVF